MEEKRKFPIEVIGRLTSVGATNSEKGMRFIFKFKVREQDILKYQLPEEVSFIRLPKDKDSMDRMIDALSVMGLVKERLGKINELNPQELFNFSSVKCDSGEFRLSLDETILTKTGGVEIRVNYINNIKGREFNRSTSTGEVENFLSSLK